MADQAVEEIIIPKQVPINPNLSVWDNLKEYLPNCSVARIIWCLLQRGWKYVDIANTLGVSKYAVRNYLLRWRRVCIEPSLKIGKCIDCERYMKMLKLFGIDVKEIERSSWWWGEDNDY